MTPRLRGFRICLLPAIASLALALSVGGSALAPCLGSAFSNVASAAEPAVDRLQFKRVLIPSNKLKARLEGSTRYVPLEKAEFERLVAATQAAPASPGPNDAHVESLRLEAKLDGDVLRGTATAQLEYRGAKPALTPLDPLRLAISQPVWTDKNTPAVLGTPGRGPALLLIEKSGALKFDWSLRGVRDESGSATFNVAVPKATINHLQLDLAEDLTPSVERAVVRATSKTAAGLRRWEIALGGNNRFLLKLTKTVATSGRRSLNLVRQSATYEFSPRGVEVNMLLRVDVLGEPLRQVRLSLEPSLTLVSARLGDATIDWQVAGDGRGGASQATLELPELLDGPGRVLRLTAFAPLTLDERWKLPRVRSADLQWQEGSSTLIIPDPFVLDQLGTLRCRQSKTAPLPSPRTGQLVEIQDFTFDAEVEVDLSYREDRTQIATAGLFALGANEMSTRLAVDLSAAQGERFSLEADVSPQWLVDSVQAVPADALADWSFNTPEAPGNKLLVRLNKPLKVKRPLRLIVNARRRRAPLGETLQADDLRPLAFRDALVKRQLVDVQVDPAYVLRLTHAEELVRLDPKSLAAPDAAAFVEPPAGVLFVMDSAAADLRFALAAKTPAFSGDLQITATVDNGQLSEAYKIECQPDAANIERLLVHLSQARSGPLDWSLVDEEGPAVVSRRLSEIEQAGAGLGVGGETWELAFRTPRRQSFTVVAKRTSRFTSNGSISLAYLNDATSQRGTLILQSLAKSLPTVVNRRLKPISAEAPPSDQYTTTIGAYRYEPARDALAASESALLVDPTPASPLRDAWAWRSELVTAVSPSQPAEHTHTFWIENAGRRTLEFALPEGASLHHVLLDGAVIETAGAGPTPSEAGLGGASLVSLSARSLGTRLSIALPAGRRFLVFAVSYQSGPALSVAYSKVQPAPIVLEAPVLSQSWSLAVPPGYGLPPNSGDRGAAEFAWQYRLFGPLARSPEQEIAHPLEPRTWTSSEERAARGEVVTAARAWIEALGATAASGDAPRTWGSLLAATHAAWEKANRGTRWTLAPLALTASQITAETPVPTVAVEDRAELGCALLAQSGLVLVVHADGFLLTTQDDAARLALRSSSCGAGMLAVTRAGQRQLEDRVARLAAQSSSSLADWLSAPQESQPAWTQAARPIQATAGWKLFRLPLATGSPQPALVYRADSRTALGWTLFLMTAAGAWWRLIRRPIWLTSLVAAAAVVALLAPLAYAPLFSAVLLGLVFGHVLCSLWKAFVPYSQRTLAAPHSAPPSGISRSGGSQSAASLASKNLHTGSSVTQAAAALPALLLWISLVAAALGWSSAWAQPGGKPFVYDVLVEVDPDGSPVGKYVYLPEAFYRTLRQVAVESQRPAVEWIVSAARYRGELSAEGLARPAVTGFSAEFTLTTLAPNVRVELPLGGDGVGFLPNGVQLDGRDVPIDLVAEQARLAVEVAQPGAHVLQVKLRPIVRQIGGSTGFEFVVPAVADSRLDLTGAGATSLTSPSAVGGIPAGVDQASFGVAIGPSDRVSMRWTAPTAAVAKAPVVDGDEVLWLNVQPGSVTIDAKFRYKVVEGRLQRIRLATDSRLKLLGFRGKGTPVATTTTIPGEPQIQQWELAQSVGDSVTIEASFLFTGASGIGQLRLPRLETLDLRSSKRTLAVSVDPSLEEKPGKDLKPLSAPEFAAIWGSSETKPQLAYSLPKGLVDWSLGARPRQPKLAARQRMALSQENGRLQVGFAATLVNTGGFRFQYRVVAPTTLEIDRVAVREGGGDRLAHWSRHTAGATSIITVFLSEPAVGEQTLILSGSQTTPSTGRAKAPEIRVEGAEIEATELLVFRRADMHVSLVDVAGLAPQDADQTEAALDRATLDGLIPEPANRQTDLVAALVAAGPKPFQATLAISRNQPSVDASQLVSLARRGDTWEATLDYQVSVQGGTVDTLYFNVPASWRGPFRVIPTAEVRVVEVPGETGRQLIVRPSQPIRDEYRIVISGPVQLSLGDRIRVPEITPSRVTRLAQYVLLPAKIDLQQLAWDTRGLKVTPLPENIPESRYPGQTVYQVIGDRYRAQLQSIERRVDPQIRLVDVSVAARGDNAYHAVATFDLEPAGLASCQLQLPAGAQLVRATVAGLPASLVRTADNRWKLALGPDQLPQRIEVLYSGTVLTGVVDSDRVFLEAPVLAGLPVERTLWTVYGPTRLLEATTERGKAIDRAQHELFRLESAAGVINSATTVASEEMGEEVARWYRPWAERLWSAETALTRELHWNPGSLAGARQAGNALRKTSGDRDHKTDDRVAEIDAEQARVARRLGASEILERVSSAPSKIDEAAALWDWSRDQQARPVHFVVEGASPTLELSAAARRLAPTWSRTLAVVLVLLLAGLAIAWIRWFPGRNPWQRSPHVILTIAGILWWLWLQPAVLGWGLILASLILATRPAWRWHRAPKTSLPTATAQ